MEREIGGKRKKKRGKRKEEKEELWTDAKEEEETQKQQHFQAGEKECREMGEQKDRGAQCELVVNGVLIQRRWDFQSKHITKLCALMWADYTHWRLTVNVENITNATLIWGYSTSANTFQLYWGSKIFFNLLLLYSFSSPVWVLWRMGWETKLNNMFQYLKH